jgi:hypothetical protein
MYGSLALGRRAQQKEGHVGRRGTYYRPPDWASDVIGCIM